MIGGQSSRIKKERKKECAVPKVDIKVEKRGERRMLFSADLRWENLEDSMDWNSVAKRANLPRATEASPMDLTPITKSSVCDHGYN